MNENQKILIVEDDDLQRQELERSINDLQCILDVDAVKTLPEAEKELQDSISEKEFFRLFLLDIHLTDDLNVHEGFQFARLIRSHAMYQMTPLIFLTSNKEQIEFALNNFHCYNYIKKPYDSKVIASQVEHLLLSYLLSQDTLTVRDTHRISHRIPKNSILFLESSAHTVKIQCENSTVYTRDYSLSSLGKQLGEDFFRCHKRFIVNVNHVEYYDKCCTTLNILGNQVPVGRSYKETAAENIHRT